MTETSPQTSKQPECHVHAGVIATGTCARCKALLCEPCSVFTLRGVQCQPCAVVSARRQYMRNFGLVVVGLVALGAAAMLLIPGKSDGEAKSDPNARDVLDEVEAEMNEAELKYGRHAYRVEEHRAALERSPCDRSEALALAKALNAASAYEETIALSARFDAECGAFPRMWWSALYAHEERHEWAPAEKLSTALIAEDPTDQDFWWWRGKQRMEQGALAMAAADFRQSIALQDLEDSSGIAILKLADIAGEIGRPCDGAFAIQALDEAGDGELTSSAIRRRNALYLEGECARLAGTGGASFAIESGTPLIEVRGQVGGVAGRFVIDTSAAYVIVTEAFAAKAKLTPEGEPVELQIAGKLSQARIAVAKRVSVGGATASDVDVAVASELPGGVDGLIGASFLWRFRVSDDYGGFLIESRGSAD